MQKRIELRKKDPNSKTVRSFSQNIIAICLMYHRENCDKSISIRLEQFDGTCFTYDMIFTNSKNKKQLIVEIEGSSHFYEFNEVERPSPLGKKVLKDFILNQRVQRSNG